MLFVLELGFFIFVVTNVLILGYLSIVFITIYNYLLSNYNVQVPPKFKLAVDIEDPEIVVVIYQIPFINYLLQSIPILLP